MWLWRCGLTGVSCFTVQETLRGDYPEPPPPAPCRLLMTWTRESLPLLLIMVSQTHFIIFSSCSAYICVFVFKVLFYLLSSSLIQFVWFFWRRQLHFVCFLDYILRPCFSVGFKCVHAVYTEQEHGLELMPFVLCFSFLSLHSAGLSEMVIETASSPGPFRNTQMSKAAQTHKLRKLRAPSKCRECDGLVVFHGAECEEVTFVSFLLIWFQN